MKKFTMTWMSAFVAAGMLAGCGDGVDENKTVDQIRQEIAGWDSERIQKIVDRYTNAIAQKTDELAAKVKELKEIPLAEQLSDKAKSLQTEIANLSGSIDKLKANMSAYVDGLTTKSAK